MRVACVFIPSLPVQLAVTADSGLRGKPVVIGGSPFDEAPVLDASPDAAAHGVRAGMPLRQAHSLCPEAAFLPGNAALYEKAFEKVLDILDSFSPAVEKESTGCAWLDVTGVGDERKIAGHISKGISAGTGLSASLGIASGRFFSRAAAVTSRPDRPVVLPRGSEKDFIAPFSIEFLPCPPETMERLSLLGIRHIGQLAGFSRDALIAQFGTDGRRMHDLARGTDNSPLVPRQKPVFAAGVLELYPPEASYLAVLKSCESLLRSLLGDTHGKLCREIVLGLGFESGRSREKQLPFKEATGSPPAVMGRIKAWVECQKFPAPVNRVGLKLFLTADTGKVLCLWQSKMETRDDVGRLVQKLRTRFGYQPLKKIEVVDAGAIFPERRTRLVEAGEKE